MAWRGRPEFDPRPPEWVTCPLGSVGSAGRRPGRCVEVRAASPVTARVRPRTARAAASGPQQDQESVSVREARHERRSWNHR